MPRDPRRRKSPPSPRRLQARIKQVEALRLRRPGWSTKVWLRGSTGEANATGLQRRRAAIAALNLQMVAVAADPAANRARARSPLGLRLRIP
jgi:hypothetical protein